MATKKEIMLQLPKGVSLNDVARALRCGKATAAKCAAKMEEDGIDSTRLDAMTDSEVSDLFADGRGKRSEEYLEPDYARVCDQLARVPKMTLALQWRATPIVTRVVRGSTAIWASARGSGSTPARMTFPRAHRARARQDDALNLNLPQIR